MYTSCFNFSCPPFENTLDQRFLFMSEGHEEVIAALLYFVRERKGFALVCGDLGTGKTMIVRHFLEKLPASVLPVVIPYPDAEYLEILRYVARVFNVGIEGKTVHELADDVKAALTQASIDGRQVVLIIDEAHLLSTGSLENIRLLSNIELTDSKLLQILLIGQNELSIKLRKDGMRQLRQRINVNRVLSPMSPQETVEYIDHRLKIAGSSFNSCFEGECRKPVYDMTGGVPRSINQLCDTALLICMIEKGKKVTRRVLKKARHALESDSIITPEARSRFFAIHPFARSPIRLSFFTAAAMILLLALVAFGYRDNLGLHLARWSIGPGGRQEVGTTVEKHRLSASEAKRHDDTPPHAGKNRSPGAARADSPPLDSSSTGANPGEALTVKKIDENATPNDSVSPSGDEAVSTPPASEQREAEGQITDKNPQSAQPPADGADRAVVEKSGTGNAARKGPQKNSNQAQLPGEGTVMAAVKKAAGHDVLQRGPEGATDDPDFFIVTIKQGENLSRLAAQWFPEDPAEGRKSILTANPEIHDQNRIFEGRTLRIPKYWRRSGREPKRPN